MASQQGISPEEQFMSLHRQTVARRSQLTAKEIEHVFFLLTEKFGEAPFHRQFSEWIKTYSPDSQSQ